MYAIVDIETTGGHAASHAITEIAILVHDGQQVVDQFHTLINPEREVPLYITALTGISTAMVASAPTFAEVSDQIYQQLHDKIFVAHNVNFDYSFIKHALHGNGYTLQTKKLCTVRLARKVLPGLPSYSLGNLSRYLGIVNDSRHRAGGDARATARLFDLLLEKGAEPVIADMLKKSSGDQWLPLQLDKAVIDALPTNPGVYYFHDNKGKIIYVGKAINIRKRVTSHFTHNDADRKRQQFIRHIASVTFQECLNELEALVLESTEIKRHWPRFNRSQKQPDQKFGLYCYEDNRGYLRLAIDKRKKHYPALYRFNLLHEGLMMLLKLTEAYNLHRKLCHLDKEPLQPRDWEFMDPPAVYNGKVKQALEAIEEELPTFLILDPDPQQNRCLGLLVEKGCFYGMGYVPAENIPEGLVDWKERLTPKPDNDFIRNSLHQYAEAHPEKVTWFSTARYVVEEL